MPELPEVHTTTIALNAVLPDLKIIGVWSDWKKQIKNPFSEFEKNILGEKIISVKRRGKNILINLSENKTLLIHMKMTGHLMYGKWEFDKDARKKHNFKKGKTISHWRPMENENFKDPFNRFIHFVLNFSNGYQLAFCDARKFGKIFLFKTDSPPKEIKKLGPEPLDKNFSFKKFKMALSKKPSGKIKKVLLDQTVIAGIGNIYSDEILWAVGIHPEETVGNISDNKLKKMFGVMKKILKKSIRLGGDSTSDYRNIFGERGSFQNHHTVYRRRGEKCKKNKCGGTIHKKIVAGRTAHFCNKHQKLLI